MVTYKIDPPHNHSPSLFFSEWAATGILQVQPHHIRTVRNTEDRFGCKTVFHILAYKIRYVYHQSVDARNLSIVYSTNRVYQL
jgi:hypothetical protein